jgi:hypothetical protein
MFSNYCDFVGDAGLYYAERTSPSGKFELAPVPETSSGNEGIVDTALDASNNLRAIYWHFTEEDDLNRYLVAGAGGWTSEVLNAPSTNVASMVLSPDGAAHLIAQGEAGTWYLTNRDGEFESEQVSEALSFWMNANGIAVDSSGRPHMLFAVGDYDRTKPGLMYAIGPET